MSTETKRCQCCKKSLCIDFFKKGTKIMAQCSACREKRLKKVKDKNLCEECSKKASYNFPDLVKGIRCNAHKIEGMVNIMTKEMGMKRFLNNIKLLGGKVIGSYKCANTLVECICPKGHHCHTKPNWIQQGAGMCRLCSPTDSANARLNFSQNIEKLGGKIVGEYRNSRIGVECICPKGHTCSPSPACIRRGQGMCKICAKNDTETAQKTFQKNIEELGGKIIGEYTNTDTPVECICRKGHKCRPRPSDIKQGIGMCSQCKQSGGEAKLYQALKDLEFTPVYQAKMEGLPTLRYDYSLSYKGFPVYFEYHGIQHEGFIPHFHDSIQDFLHYRQLDLLKVHVAKKNGIKLIIFDHTWSKKSLEQWVEYIVDCIFFRKETIIADSPLHEWVHTDSPDPKTIEKYAIF